MQSDAQSENFEAIEKREKMRKLKSSAQSVVSGNRSAYTQKVEKKIIAQTPKVTSPRAKSITQRRKRNERVKKSM